MFDSCDTRRVGGFRFSDLLFVLVVFLGFTAYGIGGSAAFAGEDEVEEGMPATPAAHGRGGSGGKTWVVSVGVGKYEKAPSLGYTVADAQAFAQTFAEVALTPKRQLACATDGMPAVEDAAAFVKFLGERLAAAEPADRLVFFFAGHGFSAPDGTTYLAPAHFDPERFKETGVSLPQLRAMLDDCRAKVKFVFLDACYSGAFGVGSRLDGQIAVDVLKEARGTVAFCGSTSKQESMESEKLKHGVFTYWLVRGLRGEANTRIDRVIDAAEVFRYIKDRVRETAQAEGVEQQPTWGFEQMPDIPALLELKRPDKPSVLVPMKRIPMGTDPGTLETILETLESFPQANPRNGIGMTKWILSHAPAGSDLAKRAQTHLDRIDAMLIDGTLRLGDAAEEE